MTAGPRGDGRPGRQAMGPRRAPGIPGPAGLHEGVSMEKSSQGTVDVPPGLACGRSEPCWPAGLAQAQRPSTGPPAIQQAASEIAAELAARCPLAGRRRGRLRACRAALFGPSALRSHLPTSCCGAARTRSRRTLRQTHLTQFSPDTWTHLYGPLFMFNGRHKVEWVADERKFASGWRPRSATACPLASSPTRSGTTRPSGPPTRTPTASCCGWTRIPRTSGRAVHAPRRQPDAAGGAVGEARKFKGDWMWTDTAGPPSPR